MEVRGALVAVAAVCAVIAVGAVGAPGGTSRDGDDRAQRDERLLDNASPTGDPTGDPTDGTDGIDSSRDDPVDFPVPQPDASWLSVPLTDDMWRRALAAADVPNSWSPLVSARLPGSPRVVLVLSSDAEGTLSVATVTFASRRPGATARFGTLGEYGSLANLVAVPARDGDQGVLVVLLPGDIGDTVVVSSSRPGHLERTSAFVDDRLALVPMTSPEEVTGLAVLSAGRTVVSTVPGGALLDVEVPRSLDRVVATQGGLQPVQVRTDGRRACRLTAASWGLVHLPWNPFDAACADVDGDLHLMLPADRDYSTVAGLAPPRAVQVRLHWRDGRSDVVRTTRDEVNAFLGPRTRPPSELLYAEALDRDGTSIRTAVANGAAS